ncbi:MAG: alkylation response protein AidB-like acyl-CoA dehydrogenase [Planctomycetota bacterium]|jgi:alkylation response protein AidB-like acyl-CoA dehydrogenase
MVQKMLADMAMKTEAARWLIYSVAAGVDAGDAEKTGNAAAMALSRS